MIKTPNNRVAYGIGTLSKIQMELLSHTKDALAFDNNGNEYKIEVANQILDYGDEYHVMFIYYVGAENQNNKDDICVICVEDLPKIKTIKTNENEIKPLKFEWIDIDVIR